MPNQPVPLGAVNWQMPPELGPSPAQSGLPELPLEKTAAAAPVGSQFCAATPIMRINERRVRIRTRVLEEEGRGVTS